MALGACSATASKSQPSTITSATATTQAQCRTANLSLGLGDRISAATGEHGDVYILTNRGKTLCQLHGYPGISPYDSKHRVLPFRYIRGEGQWVTHAVPKMVVLHPGSHAFFFVAKYRCDVGIAMVAGKHESLRRTRIDSTVTRTHIHAPSDATLLADAMRLLNRLAQNRREEGAIINYSGPQIPDSDLRW